ncbi:MAG TPA: NDP-sugar synthase [Mycobacteriales bacterium]|nr:NDP-sugar synthase [Mycobacteriales bacterium]
MEAILLVGGQGTRLRPLTVNTPKPMLPTAGVPFITHQLARLREAAVDHVVLATSYKAEVFEAHFGDGASMGLAIDYLTEHEPLGTGGGIRNAATALRGEGPVLILNGDCLSGVDLRALVERHTSTDAVVTLHLTEVADPSAFGVVPTDADGRVTAFLEKTPEPPTNRINAGCYVFGPEAFAAIPPGKVVSLERETFPMLLADGARVSSFVDTTYWLDLGRPADFVKGSCDLVLGIAPSPAVPGARGESLVLPGADVSADAKLSGGTTIGAGARVGAAEVAGSVVFDGAQIADGAVVRASIVGTGAVIGTGVVLDDVVIGDGAQVGAGCELRSGARVFPDAIIPAGGVRFSSDRS